VRCRRRRLRHRVRRIGPLPTGPGNNTPLLPGLAPRGHLPFTPRAKKTLALSLREAQALHDNNIGLQHLTLALFALQDGAVPVILSALGAPATSLRAAVLARYRKAS
jgi:Clp amino terminal domain, pathogenicity island component